MPNDGPTLIVQRPSGHDKVVNVQPQHPHGGVGIQLQPAAAAQQRPQPPPRAPPPQFSPGRQPAGPPPLTGGREEELLDTMNELANPAKASAAPHGPPAPMAGEYMDDDEDEDEDDDDEDGEEYDEDEEEYDEEEEDDDPAAAYAGGPPPPERHVVEQPSEGYGSIEEEKADIMFKLQRLHRQGVKGMRAFTPYSDIRDMRTELSRVKTELELERSVKFQRKILMAVMSALEWGNSKFDPFGLELDGFSEHMHQAVNTNTEYDGVFEELYFKYRGKVSTPPEIRLLLMVGGSAMMFHMTKSMMKSALPNLGDIMRQNPAMMETVMKGFGAPPPPPAGSGGGGGQQDDDARSVRSTGSRKEMRGPGFDVGGLTGMMGGGAGGGGVNLGAGLGGLMGLAGGGGGLGGLLGGGGPHPLGPPPPMPSTMPATTRADRARPAARPAPAGPPADDESERMSDKLSDVMTDDLESVPDDLSDRSGGSSPKNVRIAAAPAGRGRPAKRQKTSAPKVITL